MWKETIKNLGDLKEDSEYTIEFISLEKIKIKTNEYGKPSIVTSCGCTSATYNNNTNTLSVKYKSSPIPVHLLKEGKASYNTMKSIYITYIDSEGREITNTLTFTGVVHKK